MFEHIDVYYMTWYIIHGVFKAKFVNQQLMPKKACQSRDYGNLGFKYPKIATQQKTATLVTIIFLLLMDTAQTLTLATWAKVVENAIPMGTKQKDLLLDVNANGEKVDLEPISLSKMSAIKKANLNNFT